MARTPAPGTRERILTTASRLYYEHGVRAVGMNQVITEAGTGKNLLYSHFPTKNDLVAAYLERARAIRSAAARRAREAADDTPRAQLLALVAEVASTTARPGFRGCAFRNYLTEFPDDADPGDADGPPTPVGVARDFLAATHDELAGLVAGLGVADPERLLEELWLIVDGLYLQAAYRDRLDRRVAADTAVDLARRLVEDRTGTVA
ncbi:TetR/AcrR family transcriptional regulator [Actinomycetospora straminea]|uniref:TetR/AcrR family transcriptional regulator n=1 Tax=Actinomycetospora straminea TaxID=663607 RepID=A0ABP9F110_9PSEU|nr:TetR/AcrR family transcriptional regulator [Actinomycetospora straminea]MDD7932880.1 TetR/AcrR family transcriptional regulator [Actinomycetospora straminea]